MRDGLYRDQRILEILFYPMCWPVAGAVRPQMYVIAVPDLSLVPETMLSCCIAITIVIVAIHGLVFQVMEAGLFHMDWMSTGMNGWSVPVRRQDLMALYQETLYIQSSWMEIPVKALYMPTNNYWMMTLLQWRPMWLLPTAISGFKIIHLLLVMLKRLVWYGNRSWVDRSSLHSGLPVIYHWAGLHHRRSSLRVGLKMVILPLMMVMFMSCGRIMLQEHWSSGMVLSNR